MTTTNAALGQHTEAELKAFVDATGFHPGAVRESVLVEIDEILKADPQRGAVRHTLEGPHVFDTILARTGGSFADHVAFRSLMLGTDAAEGYRAYMRIWLAGEMFFFHPEQFYLLPDNFRLTQYP